MVFFIAMYERQNGNCPARDALSEFEHVSPKLRSAAEACIIRLEDSANHSVTLIEKVSPDLWYLRVRRGGNIARIFFIFLDGARIILLNGFVKKTDKIPPAEIKRAKHLFAELKLEGANFNA